MNKYFESFRSENVRSVVRWLIAVAIIVGVVVALCFLTNPVAGKDRLTAVRTYILEDAGTDIGGMECEVLLGDKVKSGQLYMEQWYEGVCERSLPAIMTQDLTYLSLVMRGNEQGYSATITTNEFGGEWESYFSIPYDEEIRSWSLSVMEEGQTIGAQAGGESILCTLDYDNGRQFVVRAVWSKEMVWSKETDKEKEADSVRPYYMKMFRLDEEIKTKDPARKDAYIAALERLIYRRKSPDGGAWVYGTQEFAVLDIDGDGAEELIIRENQEAMASMRLTVYDYDESTGGVREEVSVFPSVRFYENGVVVADASHNQGPASGAEDFWPYQVYHYNRELDKYGYIAYVEGWYNSPEREMYEGNEFPKEADLNGDGMVYYIMPGKYKLENPVDNAAYEEWRQSAVGEAEEITFFFRELPTIRVPAAG